MPNWAGIEDHNGSKAELLAEGYKTIPFEKVFAPLYDKLRKASQQGHSLRIVDIGSGAGNIAHDFASMGHVVVAVEPSDLRKIAIRDYSHPNIDYRNDTLPSLVSIEPEETFDVALLASVWHYIVPDERVASLVKIAQGLGPKGTVVITYPLPPTRDHQYEITPEMMQLDIAQANKQLPNGKKLTMAGEPTILPELRLRKSLDGRDIQFYTFTLSNSRAAFYEQDSLSKGSLPKF